MLKSGWLNINKPSEYTSAKIVAILKKKDRVVLELQDLTEAQKDKIGKRTIKKSPTNPKGGLVERSVSVHVSNVQKKA